MSSLPTVSIIILGDTGVGKSCLLLQFIDKRYTPMHDLTIGIDYGAKVVQLKDNSNNNAIKKDVKIQIWDTAGQESFQSIARSYYRDAETAFLVYDCTRKESLDHLHRWLNEARRYGKPELMFAVIANKSDLPQSKRQVTKEQGEAFAHEHGIAFYEVSAKTSTGVDECFMKSAQNIFDNQPEKWITKDHRNSIRLNSQPSSNNNGARKCC